MVIAGYYGFGNAGDELILLSLIRKFRKERPQIKITVFSADPSETVQAFNIQAVHRWRPWLWLRPLAEADRFVLGGGGLLQEATRPWNYLYYLSLLVIAKVFGCRTEVVAIGVDPITRPWNRFWTRLVLQLWTDRISVRDEGSRQALQAAGLRAEIQITRDPVFELETVAPSIPRNGIGLAVSVLRSEPQWANQIAELCDRLADGGSPPIDLLVLFPEEDEAFAFEVARLSSAVRNVRVWKTPEDILSWIPQYQVIAGTRFHALVLAAASQVPFTGWGDQRKVISLCEQFHRPFWTPPETWNSEEQCRIIHALCESPDKSVILAE